MSSPYDPPPPNPYEASHQPAMPPKPGSGDENPVLGIVSLVTGIMSFVPGCCCGLIGIPLALAAIATGIIGLVMANQGKMGGKPFAIAGLVCGGVYLLVFVVMMILNIFFNVALNPQDFQNLEDF